MHFDSFIHCLITFIYSFTRYELFYQIALEESKQMKIADREWPKLKQKLIAHHLKVKQMKIAALKRAKEVKDNSEVKGAGGTSANVKDKSEVKGREGADGTRVKEVKVKTVDKGHVLHVNGIMVREEKLVNRIGTSISIEDYEKSVFCRGNTMY
jgi:hypothetical protein